MKHLGIILILLGCLFLFKNCGKEGSDIVDGGIQDVQTVEYTGVNPVNSMACSAFQIRVINADGALVRAESAFDVPLQVSENAEIYANEACDEAVTEITIENSEFLGRGYIRGFQNGTMTVHFGQTQIASVTIAPFSPQFQTALDGPVTSILGNPSGRMGVMISGDFGNTLGRSLGNVVKVFADGTLDEEFHQHIDVNGDANEMVPTEDGYYLIGSLSNEGIFITGLGKVRDNGRMDLLFSDAQDNIFLNGVMQGGAMDDQGRLVIGGRARTYAGQSIRGLVRIDANAQVDDFIQDPLLFDYNETSSAGIYEIFIDDNQDIYALGSITTFDTSPHYGHMVRIKPDGTRDASFSPGFSGPTNVMAKFEDFIYVGGLYSTVGGIQQFRLTRLNLDGSVDTTFLSASEGFNAEVQGVWVDNQGRVYVGGEFTTFNGIAVEPLVRLLPDGSLDNTYTPELNGHVLTIAHANDQSQDIWVGGAFTEVNGETQQYLVRLDDEGNLD